MGQVTSKCRVRRAWLSATVNLFQHALLDESLLGVQLQRLFEQRLYADGRPLLQIPIISRTRSSPLNPSSLSLNPPAAAVPWSTWIC